MPKVPKSYLEARRNEIVDAAMTCFLRKGFHQTTMQDICKEAQLSPGAVYRYFASKSEIMTAVINRNTEQWSNLVELAKQMAPEPDQALELVGRYFFNRFREPGFEQDARVSIESWPESLRNPELRASVRRHNRSMRKMLADLIRPQLEAYPDVDADALLTMYMALYTGLTLNKAFDPEGVDTDAVFAVLKFLFAVFEAEPSAQRRDVPTAEPLPLRELKAEKEA